MSNPLLDAMSAGMVLGFSTARNHTIVNKAYADAAMRRAPLVKAHLIEVFRGQWPKLSERQLSQRVDEMAAFMGRHMIAPDPQDVKKYEKLQRRR
jgi:hypothetical protein